MRLLTCFFILLLLPFTVFAEYKRYDRTLPGLEELSRIVSQGSEEKKIKSLGRFYTLSKNREYWRLKENWLPLVALVNDKSPRVRTETVRYCAYLTSDMPKGGPDPFVDPDFNPTIHTTLIPTLRNSLLDPDPAVRKEACRTIKKYNDKGAIPLLDQLLDDVDPWTQLEAIAALSRMAPHPTPLVFNHLIKVLERDREWPYVLVQRQALRCLQKLQLPTENTGHFFTVVQKGLSSPYLTKDTIDLLFSKFDYLTPDNRGYLFSLLDITDKRIPQLVLQNLEHRSPPPALFVQSSDPAKQISCNPTIFSDIKDENGAEYDMVELLTPLLSSVYPEIRATVTDVIRRIEKSSEAAELLINLASDTDSEVRERAIRGLLHAQDPRITPLLDSLVDDPDDKIRQVAIRVTATRMENEKSSELKTFLLDNAHDPYPPIRLYIARKLFEMKVPELMDIIIPHLADKGMDKVFDQLIGIRTIEKAYIYRKPDGTRMVTADREQMPENTNYSVKFIQDQAVEHLLQYLANCRGDCSVWQKQLVRFEHSGVESYLLQMTASSDPQDRQLALQWLGPFATDRAMAKVKSLLDDQDMGVVQATFQTIGRLHYTEFTPLILDKLQAPDKHIRKYAAAAAGSFATASEEMITALTPLLTNPDNHIRSCSLDSLNQLHYRFFTETALQMLRDQSEKVRRSALVGLRSSPPADDALTLLFDLIDGYENKDGFHDNAVYAVQVIGRIGSDAAIEPLLDLLGRCSAKPRKSIRTRGVSRSVVEALGDIGSPRAVVSLVHLLDSASFGRDAYRILAQNLAWGSEYPSMVQTLSWADVQEILKNEPDSDQLWTVFEHQFPEEEEFAFRLGKLIKTWQASVSKPGLPKEQWPSISSRYVLQRRIRAGTLRMDQGRNLKELIRPLLREKDKNIVRNAAKDLSQMQDMSLLRPVQDSILIECSGSTISPIIKDLIYSLYKLGSDDVIPFLVRSLDCPAPLASFHFERFLEKNFTKEEIYAALEKDQESVQLVKTYSRYFSRHMPTDTTTVAAQSSRQRPRLSPPPPLSMSAGFQGPRSRRMGEKPVVPGKEASKRAGIDSQDFSRNSNRKGRNCEDIVPNLTVSPPEKMARPIYSPEKLSRLKRQLKNKDGGVRRSAADILGDSRDLSVAELLIPLLKDNDAYVRQAAVRSLGKLRADQAIQPMLTLLDDEDQHVQVWAAFGLHRMNNPLIEPVLVRHQDTTDSNRLDRINRLLSGYP